VGAAQLDGDESSVIDRTEILRLANEFGLEARIVEKDYILGWLLAGIYRDPLLAAAWVFKGGTCLKKCFFETYRFSEDLDFTVTDATQLDAGFLEERFAELSAEAGANPDVRDGVGSALIRSGQIREFLGQQEDALRAYGKAQTVYDELCRDYPAVSDYRSRLAESYGADHRTCSYFQLHQHADVEHAHVWRDLLAQQVELKPEQAERALEAAEDAAQALWTVLDAMEDRRTGMVG